MARRCHTRDPPLPDERAPTTSRRRRRAAPTCRRARRSRTHRADVPTRAISRALGEVVKSWPSEWCLEANKLAIQVLGGAGYVQDYPVEQLYRDQRLNMIHEVVPSDEVFVTPTQTGHSQIIAVVIIVIVSSSIGDGRPLQGVWMVAGVADSQTET